MGQLIKRVVEHIVIHQARQLIDLPQHFAVLVDGAAGGNLYQ